MIQTSLSLNMALLSIMGSFNSWPLDDSSRNSLGMQFCWCIHDPILCWYQSRICEDCCVQEKSCFESTCFTKMNHNWSMICPTVAFFQRYWHQSEGTRVLLFWFPAATYFWFDQSGCGLFLLRLPGRPETPLWTEDWRFWMPGKTSARQKSNSLAMRIARCIPGSMCEWPGIRLVTCGWVPSVDRKPVCAHKRGPAFPAPTRLRLDAASESSNIKLPTL